MGGYLLCVILFVCLSFCLFVCTVTDFSAAEKGSGVKFLHPCYYLDRSSPILEVKGQGHLGRKMRIHEASWQPGPQSVKKHLYRDRSGAVGTEGGGVASGSMVGFVSCKTADALGRSV